VWAFLQKFTNALGIWVSGLALAWFGYVPNVPQSDTALLGIRLFFSLIPALALIISLPILFRYPITQKSHAEVVKELQRRSLAAVEVEP
jgi:GPH family glycoside/pentoside/hexuronide:cation symporter